MTTCPRCGISPIVRPYTEDFDVCEGAPWNHLCDDGTRHDKHIVMLGEDDVRRCRRHRNEKGVTP